MLIVGCIGLGLNILCVAILGGHGHDHGHDHGHSHHGHHHHSSTSTEATETHSDTEEHDSHHGTALSIKAVLLHIAADALNNLAVIVSAVVMWKIPSGGPPGHGKAHKEPKYYADPACTVAIAIMIILGTLPLTKKSGKALMDSAMKRREGTITRSTGIELSEIGCICGKKSNEKSTTVDEVRLP